MLTGFNTDFKYKGTVYHVQTEDNGRENPTIITLLYQGGAIIASRKTSYADILKFEQLDKVVKEFMEQQHKQIIKDLIAGKFTRPEPGAPPEKPAGEVLPETADNSDGSLDDIILNYLSSEEENNSK